MNAAQLAKLLGRPLTPVETANFELYLSIARSSLETMLCLDVCKSSDPRVFDTRENYRTVFTGIFTSLDEVKIDGVVIDPSEYSVRQWDKRSVKWYNSVVFNDRFDDEPHEVEVSANWGFTTMPNDMQLLLAGLFDLITKKNTLNAVISRKTVEDFTITFNNDVILDTAFTQQNQAVISKYSMCDIPYIAHGSTCPTWN